MTYGAGSLTITARRAGPRTILERLRFDGISRCSRAFADGAAARVVLSQLGPGVVRGDAVTTSGRVHAGAHLIVTNQTATRLMGGTRQSLSRARWVLDDNAILELVGEPLVAYADADYDASTSIELGAQSWVLMTELANAPAGTKIRLRTSIKRHGRELLYDAFVPAAAAPYTVGTFAFVGLSEAEITPVLATLDRTADHVAGATLGVGTFPTGVFARVIATDIWTVRSALITLRAAAWFALGRGQQPSNGILRLTSLSASS